MPLTHAIYVPSTGKIYGARSGVLFEFTSAGVSTGNRLTFADPLPGYSHLALDLVGGLWVSLSCDALDDERRSVQGFYKIDPAAMSVLSFKGFDGTYNFPGNTVPNSDVQSQSGMYNAGPTWFQFQSDGTVVGMTMGAQFDGCNVFRLNSTLDTILMMQTSMGTPSHANGLYWDFAASTAWLGNFQTIMTAGLQVPGFPGQFDNLSATNYNYGSTTLCFYGFDYVPAVDTFFISTRTTKLILMNKSTQVFTTKDLVASRPGMLPRMAKYVPWKSRVYLPTMTDNAVVEVDVTGTVTNVYTGFDCPFDILDTGTKVFAIQLGGTPLKLVTT